MERDRSVSLFAIELTTACFGSDAKIQSIFVVSLHRLRELICECKLYIVRLRKLPRKLQTDHLNSKFWDGRRSDDDSNYLRLALQQQMRMVPNPRIQMKRQHSTVEQDAQRSLGSIELHRWARSTKNKKSLEKSGYQILSHLKARHIRARLFHLILLSDSPI